MNINDKLLVRLLRDKNKKAYSFLFNNYYSTLTSQAFYLLRNKMDAEDQVQDLFLEIIDGKLTVNANISLLAYLRKCICHKCLLIMTKEKKYKKYLSRYQEMMTTLDNTVNHSKPEINNTVDQLLKVLPAQRLQVCKLVYLENKKYKEAAVEMGITINSVKTHLRLANKNLKERFLDTSMHQQFLQVLYA